MQTARFLLSAALLAAAAACGSDNGTGSTPVSLTGEWSYSLDDIGNARFTCDFTGGTLRLTQTGDALEGELDPLGAEMVCTTDAGQFSPSFPSGRIAGTVDGSRVTLVQQEMADVEVRYRGIEATLSGGQITGTITVRELWPEGVRAFTGTFRAQRRVGG